MATFTTRFAARTAAVLALATVGGLAGSAAMAADQAPTAAATAGTTALVQPQTAESNGQAPRDGVEGELTKGTEVEVRNHSSATMWVREYWGMREWGNPVTLEPGQRAFFWGDRPAMDDVELRLFNNRADAWANRNSFEVDAENPMYSLPWMSIGYSNAYFYVGGSHTWKRDDGNAEFFGYRHEDSKNYKRLELTVKKMP